MNRDTPLYVACPHCGGKAYPGGNCFRCGKYLPARVRYSEDPDETDLLHKGFHLTTTTRGLDMYRAELFPSIE